MNTIKASTGRNSPFRRGWTARCAVRERRPVPAALIERRSRVGMSQRDAPLLRNFVPRARDVLETTICFYIETFNLSLHIFCVIYKKCASFSNGAGRLARTADRAAAVRVLPAGCGPSFLFSPPCRLPSPARAGQISRQQPPA
jgi:hypothetical protein